jgi:hypothetical protein
MVEWMNFVDTDLRFEWMNELDSHKLKDGFPLVLGV